LYTRRSTVMWLVRASTIPSLGPSTLRA